VLLHGEQPWKVETTRKRPSSTPKEINGRGPASSPDLTERSNPQRPGLNIIQARTQRSAPLLRRNTCFPSLQVTTSRACLISCSRRARPRPAMAQAQQTTSEHVLTPKIRSCPHSLSQAESVFCIHEARLVYRPNEIKHGELLLAGSAEVFWPESNTPQISV
jgi:hypothetical protein